MSANYDGLDFSTRLHAQWAAFFDLAGWRYWTNPVAVGDWRPDFKVRFECGHSECPTHHTLLVSVLPYTDLNQFANHPCTKHAWQVQSNNGERLADAGAGFGLHPEVTRWEMSHGAGGGVFEVPYFADDSNALWERAAKLVR